MNFNSKILGCLIGAAYGDALGAPTETRTTEQIIEKFGGYITTLIAPPLDVFARGNKAGEVTDDFSMAYVTCLEILKNKGIINDFVAVNSLIEWSKNEVYFEQFVGPTSREGINRLKNSQEAQTSKFINDNLKGTNGAAMKIAPISLFSGGDFQKAMDITTIIAKPTHYNNKSLSGACAVAAMVSDSLTINSSLKSLIESAINGAKYGEKLGHQLAGPSVVRRIELAIEIALRNIDPYECMKELANIIGNNASAYETVPTAIGIIVNNFKNPIKAIEIAANIGNDTDSIATIVGGVLGTYYGNKIFDENILTTINKANGYDLEEFANEINKYIGGNNE